MGSSPKAPTVPTTGENFAESIKVLLENQEQLRSMQFDDSLAALDTLRRMAPAAANVQLDFERQYGPAIRAQQSEATRQTRAGDLYNTMALTPGIRHAEALADPYGSQMRNALGQQLSQELAAGASLDPELRRETEQQIRRAQQARGITHGSAPVSSEALFVGARGEQLRRQRQAAAQNFIQFQQATQMNPFAFASGQPVQQAQPSMPSGQNMGMLPSLYQGATNSNNMQSQLAFNASQAGGGMGSGIGSALGMGAGLLLAPATGGLSAKFMPMAVGGMLGGSVGSMFR